MLKLLKIYKFSDNYVSQNEFFSLCRIQTERERRHKLKEQCAPPSRRSRFEHSTPDVPPVTDPLGVSLSSEDVVKTGSYPTVQDDETSTNIYLGNINPQVCFTLVVLENFRKY